MNLMTRLIRVALNICMCAVMTHGYINSDDWEFWAILGCAICLDIM